MSYLNLETVETIIRNEAPKPIVERQLENFGEDVEQIQVSTLRFILQTIKPELWNEKGEDLIGYLKTRSENGSVANEENSETLRIQTALSELIKERDLLETPQRLRDRGIEIDPDMFFAKFDALADYSANAGFEDIR